MLVVFLFFFFFRQQNKLPANWIVMPWLRWWCLRKKVGYELIDGWIAAGHSEPQEDNKESIDQRMGCLDPKFLSASNTSSE